MFNKIKRKFNLMQKLWEKNRRIRELEEENRKSEERFQYTVDFYEGLVNRLWKKLDDK